MMRHTACLIAPCLLLAAAPARADGPVQPWPTLVVTAGLGGKWSATGDVVARLSRDPLRASQLRGRVFVARKVRHALTLSLGYAHIVSAVDGSISGIEDQLIEQIGWAPHAIGPVALSLRTRLEQRFIGGNGATAWRARAQVRAVMPIAGPVSGVLWGEPFVALNRTHATPLTFEQLRLFAGVSLRLSPHADVELGYLRQHLRRASGTLDNDVVPVVLNLHF